MCDQIFYLSLYSSLWSLNVICGLLVGQDLWSLPFRSLARSGFTQLTGRAHESVCNQYREAANEAAPGAQYTAVSVSKVDSPRKKCRGKCREAKGLPLNLPLPLLLLLLLLRATCSQSRLDYGALGCCTVVSAVHTLNGASNCARPPPSPPTQQACATVSRVAGNILAPGVV